jgi:uncharacterized protein YggE
MIVPKVLLALLAVIALTQGQIIGSPLSASLFYQGLSAQTCCSDQTITVYGSATIQAPPDSATLSVQVTVSGSTVNAVIALLSAKVNSVISILNSNGLNSSNYQTSSLNVYPNTSWANGVSTVVGQIATQSFTITVPIINSNTVPLGKLIDCLASVDGIVLNGVSFDVADKTDELAAARGKAFANAQKKASDYAASLQLCLGQLVQIIDSYSSAPVVREVSGPVLSVSNSMVAATPTTINAGTISISYNVEAIYSYN